MIHHPGTAGGKELLAMLLFLLVLAGLNDEEFPGIVPLYPGLQGKKNNRTGNKVSG